MPRTRTLNRKRYRFIRSVSPSVNDEQLEELASLLLTDYLVWKVLVQNLNVWVCRKCLAETVADLGGTYTQIEGNGSNSIRTLKRKGFLITTGVKDITTPCSKHGRERHKWDRLESVLPTVSESRLRVGITPTQRAGILTIIGHRDEVSKSLLPVSEIEIDHRSPRWDEMEEEIDLTNPEAIRARFQPLSKVNNNIKRERCNTCQRTGKRASSRDGIEFWYEGNKTYTEALGCEGCFWFDPAMWRNSLQERLERLERLPA